MQFGPACVRAWKVSSLNALWAAIIAARFSLLGPRQHLVTALYDNYGRSAQGQLRWGASLAFNDDRITKLVSAIAARHGER